MLNDELMQKAVSVSEINATLKACLDSPIFKNLLVYGEVSGFKISAGNAYFTLKDRDSAISCNCWGVSKTYAPKDGEGVIVRGYIDYWTKGGRLNFVAREIIPAGQGLLYVEFEKLKAKLLSEGLFAEEHKIAIPEYPKKVVVVTSKTGAVIRDIVTTIRRKNPVIDIIVKDVRVQGENAAKEISRALLAVDKLGYDVIILARGGGSLEDLAPFYDEGLVRTIYALDTPIISAVGHETDFSLADFVADMRAPTPTAAGEAVAYDWYALRDTVREDMRRLSMTANGTFAKKLAKVQIMGVQMQKQAGEFLTTRLHKVQMINANMLSRVGAIAQKDESRFQIAAAALDNLSPLKTLKRGYFRVAGNDGKAVTEVKRLKIGDGVNVKGKDGSFDAVVLNINPEKTEENK